MPRTLRVLDSPDQIVPDWPKKPVRGRAARLAAIRAERAAKAAEKAAQARTEPDVSEGPTAGTADPSSSHLGPPTTLPGVVSPQEMFPDWDWLLHPEGPPLEDPQVAAYTQIMWKAIVAAGRKSN